MLALVLNVMKERLSGLPGSAAHAYTTPAASYEQNLSLGPTPGNRGMGVPDCVFTQFGPQTTMKPQLPANSEAPTNWHKRLLP